MYDWLDTAIRDSSHVVTANRRLARVLTMEYAERRVRAGDTVWPTPVIQSWTDWISGLISANSAQDTLPTLITSHQSRILWERCLRRELSDPLLNIGMLARQSRDAWARLQEWRVPISECQRQARNRDQRMFARTATAYQSVLERETWVDESGLADVSIDLIRTNNLSLPPRVTLAGFDRVTPQFQALLDAYREVGGEVESITNALPERKAFQVSISNPENGDAELRSAGAWAREELRRSPDARLAIVVTHLEQNAQRTTRLIKEGLIPGWQNANKQQNSVINVSYGKKLTDYPAVASALLALSWLCRELTTRDISCLLRSSIFDSATNDERTRYEMRLRQLPEQNWSPQQLLAQFEEHLDDGLDIARKMAAWREAIEQRQSPAKWVLAFSEILHDLGWPGTESLSSAEFQTVNRWRELLNEVARLELVAASMSAAEALGRIATIAAETVFQPEGGHAAVNVMGPLEAAGLEFDTLWVTGASSDNWPPQSRPLSLVSRDLQRDYGLPDATPADTLDYATRVITRLATSSSRSIFSYPQTHGDAQQSASELLAGLGSISNIDHPDPGWNAGHQVGSLGINKDLPDPVPPVLQDESIAGGAATIQRQFVEPFAAFVAGRLGVRSLWPMQAGLPANIRGSLIHNALHKLYSDCPCSEEIRSWDDAELETRTEQAVQAAFRPHERHADGSQRQLLALEKVRTKLLLRGVIATDAQRDEFCVSAVEKDLEFSISGLNLQLRVDRIDDDRDKQQIILDYKTGMPKRLLDRDKNPRDMQLIVYAYALGSTVSGVGLFNIDARAIALDAAGRNLSNDVDWDNSLATWKAQIENAALEIAAGDVRVSAVQTTQQSRPFGLLSRFRELLHER